VIRQVIQDKLPNGLYIVAVQGRDGKDGLRLYRFLPIGNLTPYFIFRGLVILLIRIATGDSVFLSFSITSLSSYRSLISVTSKMTSASINEPCTACIIDSCSVYAGLITPGVSEKTIW